MSWTTKRLVTYSVWSLDVWGHGPDECCASYNCACIASGEDADPDEDADEDGEIHHADKCECGFQVNDRSRIGEIEIETDEGVTYNADSAELRFTSWTISDEALIRALVESGDMKDTVTADDVEIDGEWDGDLWLNQARDSRPVFQLQCDGDVEILDVVVLDPSWRAPDVETPDAERKP